MMKDFSESIEQESSRAALLDALGGRGAFGRFKRTAARLGLRERWFAYRQRELEAIAKDWLEQQGLEVR